MQTQWPGKAVENPTAHSGRCQNTGLTRSRSCSGPQAKGGP